ncbi:MAG: leucine-rich repeat protein [Saccharofermentanales bacterium]
MLKSMRKRKINKSTIISLLMLTVMLLTSIAPTVVAADKPDDPASESDLSDISMTETEMQTDNGVIGPREAEAGSEQKTGVAPEETTEAATEETTEAATEEITEAATEEKTEAAPEEITETVQDRAEPSSEQKTVTVPQTETDAGSEQETEAAPKRGREAVPEDAESPKPSAKESKGGEKSNSLFIYEMINEGTAIRITGWTGTGTIVTIPETIDGLPVTEITRGEVSSFQTRGLTEVAIPNTVKKIGDYAFAGNALTTFTIPTDSLLTEIGVYTFADNNLTGFSAPSALRKIGSQAFMQNRLTGISLNEGLETIGSEAFALNDLTEATIPDTVTGFGLRIFDANGGRFVKVYTESPAVPPYENNGPRFFGYVVNPITVTFNYVDKETGSTVMSSVTLGDDMTDINGVFVKNVEMTYQPPKLTGYYVEPSITFTPDREGYVVTIRYTREGPPNLTYPTAIRLPKDITEDEARARILDAITATDYTGKDISDKVVANLAGLDLSTNGFYYITISLTDDYGYQISESIQVQVGEYDWLNHEIGGGWVLGDFSFSADGKTLLGLSTQGIAKLRALPAGGRNLVLPAHSYNNPDIPITAIGDSAFYSNIYNVPLETVDFSQMNELQSIGRYAFYSYSRPRASAISTVVGFNELTKLKTIGDYAFRATTASFNLDNFRQLTTIGSYAFSSYSTSYQGPQIILGSLPGLTRIGSSAFYGASVPIADLRGMPNLTGIEAYTFAYAGVEELYFPEVDHDFAIAYQAFYRNTNKLTTIDFTPIAEHLTSIGSEAFSNLYGTTNLATTVVWPDLPKLSSVGSRILYNRNLNMNLDLSGSPLLTTIGSNAFEQAGLTGFTLPETVETIGSYAFYNNRISEINFGLIPNLKTIGYSAFRSNQLAAVDLSDLAKLEMIDDNAFQSNQIESVNLNNLPQLTTIGSSAFANNRIADLTLGTVLGPLPKLEVIKSQAFYSNWLTSLAINNLPSLISIESSAFAVNRLTELTISNNPELASIGNYAFQSNQLAEATLENLPKLTDLEPYTFSNNPGHVDYYNNVVVWDLPKDDNTLPSKANYLVNPDTEESLNNVWVAEDFTYTVTNGEATITGFSEQGSKRFGLVPGVRPVIFPAKDPAENPVVGIADHSFANKNLDSIDLTGMTSLRTIGASAFYNNRLTEVSFNGLDNLVEIGSSAFSSNKLSQVDLGILNKLQRIGTYAFSSNLITKVKLAGAVSLQTIDTSAFQSNRISEIDFGYLPKLTLINSNAFYSQGGDPLRLDLSGLTALQTIGYKAFESTNLVSLVFGDLKNLTSIGTDAFSNHRLTGELDLSGLDSLTTINSDAFETSSSSSYGITNVIFPDSGNLVNIYSYAFRYNRLQEVDLRKQTKLASIGSYAFAGNLIEDIKFPQDAPLNAIQSYAFQSNRLRELDLRPLTNLKYLYYSTFGYNAIGDVYAPDSLTSLNDYTFYYNKINVGSAINTEAIIHINEPTTLKNYTNASGWGHLINPKKLIFTYRDRDGNEILPSRTEYYKGTKTSETYYAPDMALYLANPASETVMFRDDQSVYNIEFVYDALVFFATDNVTIEHANVGTNRAYVGNILNTSLKLGLSSESEEYENVELRVYYNPEFIDSTKVTAPLLGNNDYTITKPTDGKPYISFNFPRLVGGQSFEIPVTWAFKKDYTPQNQVEILYTQLRDANNELIAAAVDQTGKPMNPTIEAYYNEPYIEKGAVGTNQYIGGPRVAGSFKTTEINGQNVNHVDVPVDVTYSFRIMQSTYNSNFDRNIESIKYIDMLPSYEAVENGSIVTKTALINLDTSPNWSYYDPLTEMPTDEVTAYGIVILPNYDKDYAYSYPTLNLQFPGGIKDQTVTNNVEVQLTPANKPAGEPVIVKTDGVPISLIPGSAPPQTDPVAEVTNLTKSVYPLNVLDYKPTKENASFTWPIRFVVGTNDLAVTKVFTNVVFEDFALDDRLVFTKVQLPSTGHMAIVKAYRSDGTEIVDYGGATSGGVYEFPEYNDGMERIDKITVDLGNREVMTGYSINVVTAFANPDDETKDYYACYNSTDHVKNYLPNSAKATASYTADGVSGTYTSGTATRRVQILPFELKVIPDKIQTFRSSESGEDMETQLPQYPGDEGRYTIGIKRSLNNRPFTMTDADLPIYNFRLVDLLPVDIVVKPENILLKKEFALQPGAKFEMVADYGSTGRVAIIFTADSVTADVTTVAFIDAKLDLAMNAGFHTNDLYLSFDTGTGHDWDYGQPVTTADLGDNPENPYMHDYVSLFMAKAQAMNAVKYVRNAKIDAVTGGLVGTGTWSDGIYTEDSGYFQYRLFVKNDTIHDRDHNEIYDVFPYYLDKVTQMNSEGLRASRGSAFSNKILAARLEGTTADQFKIQFTTGNVNIPDYVEAGVYLKGLTWVDAGANGSAPEGVTAMRIIPESGSTGLIKKEDTLIVIVDAQAPEHNAETSGKRGYNSFIRTDDALGDRFLEVQSVWNEVPAPQGTLRIEKRSRTFDPVNPARIAYNEPLSGAEFTLYNEGGIPIKTAVSNSEGFAEFADLRVGTYYIVETGFPPGHYVPEDNPQIKVERSDWENQPNLIYTVGPLYNDPIVTGTVVLEKLNGAGELMPGIAFALTDQSSGNKFMATTGSDGRATFKDLPYGAYRLTETNAPKLLLPITPITVKIDAPDKLVQFTGETALRNDRAEVALFKLGIRETLDPEKDLSQYTKADGTIVSETWKFEIKNLTNPQETVRQVTFSSSNVQNGVKLSNLKVGDLYEIKEISGPVQTQTLYNHNSNTYTFKINQAGELVDADGQKFKAQNIYFPNERKTVDGSVVITKQDVDEIKLTGATFSLAKLNKVTSTFEELGRKNSDATGLVKWDQLSAGSYEIREVAAPAGYIKTSAVFRFVVEDFATTGMLTNSSYTHRVGGLTHNFKFTAVNRKIDLSLVKRHLVAKNVPEAERDILIAQNPGYKWVAKQVGYDVYEVLGGAVFTLYQEVEVDGVKEKVVVAQGLVSDAEGLIPVNDIPGFSWDETGIYYLEETAPPNNDWLKPAKMLKIDLPSVIRNNPAGTATVFMENQRKLGQILISKYDRYTGTKLEGVEFTLYKGTKDTYLSDPNPVVRETDMYGYRRFDGLSLGNYVLEETKTLDGYILDDTIYEIAVTSENRYFYYHIYNMREGELLDIPVKKEWLGAAPEYDEGEGLVVELYGQSKTDPEHLIDVALLTDDISWSHTFKDLLKEDSQGNSYSYTIKERAPSGYTVAVGEGTVNGSDYGLGQMVADEIVLKNHALGNLSVSKVWQGPYPELRPAFVQLTLMRAEYNAASDSYGEYTAQGATVNISEATSWAHTWKGLKTHDVNGNIYRYKVAEAAVTGYQPVSHNPDFVELTSGTEVEIELINRQILTQKASKVWSDNSPTVKPTVVLQLVRKTAEMAEYEVVLNAELKTIPDGSGTVYWNDLPSTDNSGNIYSYSVFEGYCNSENEFVLQSPENYRVETTCRPVQNAAGIEIGTEVIVTNSWQETSLTATKTWSEDSPSVKPDIELVLRQNGELYNGTGEPKLVRNGEFQATWENLPVYYYKDNNGTLEEYTYHYSVDEVNVPESYDKILISTTEVLNDYNPVSLEARKIFDLSDVMADFQGVNVLPQEIKFSLYKTTFDEDSGTTSMMKFDEVVLDGVVDTDINDSGEIREWLYSWNKLPKYYDLIDENGQLTRAANEYKIIEETIPDNYELIDTKDVSDEGMFRWEVTNRYCNGFTAHKTWDIGNKTIKELNGLPELKLQLYRGIESDDGTRIDETAWSEIVDEAVTLDGKADDLGLGISRETTQEDSLTWTYTWFDLPIYGEAGADLNAYGINEGDRVHYFYYIKEEMSESVAQDYSLDPDSSTSTSLVNRLDKTNFTARKRWVNGPVLNRPEVEFVLYHDYINPSTGKSTDAEEIARAKLDGKVDQNGEVKPWIYEFKNLKHYVKNEDGTYLKDTEHNPVPYRYFVQEEVVPDDYKLDILNTTDSEITNSYVIPKDDFEVTKLWKGGNPDDYGKIAIELYRISDVMAEAELASSSYERIVKSETEFVYKFKNLDITDINGNPYTYFAKEVGVVDRVISIGQNQYRVELTDDTITNTYLLKRIDAEVEKTWIGGSDHNRPDIYFKLYRSLNGAEKEAVPDAEVKLLAKGATKVVWKNIESEAAYGKSYTFTVQEGIVDRATGKFTEINPDNYTVKYDGLSVTNSYVSPPIDVVGTKTWRGGENVNTPDVYFRLMRKTANGIPHAVPDTEIKGPYKEDVSFVWTDLDKTDSKENIYRYFVEEGTLDEETGEFIKGAPEQYKLSGSDLNLINTYVPETGTIEAAKTWVGGEKTVRPVICFELQRKTAEMKEYEVVPEAEVLELVDGVEKVTWEVEIEDASGLPYQFRVVEGTLVDNEFIEIVPDKYEAAAEGLTVTNTYIISRGEVKAVKTWQGGSKIERTDVYFKLQRTLAGVTEDVPDAEILKLEDNTVTWSDIELETFEGVPYEFTVREFSLDQATGEFIEQIPGYKSEVAGLDVTNIYVSPVGEVIGTKKWIGGPDLTRPTIWFKLYRESELVEYEAVPDTEILELAEGQTEVKWNNIELKDFEGNDYQFTVKEVNEFGEDFVPENYNKTEDGLIVINTFIPDQNPNLPPGTGLPGTDPESPGTDPGSDPGSPGEETGKQDPGSPGEETGKPDPGSPGEETGKPDSESSDGETSKQDPDPKLSDTDKTNKPGSVVSTGENSRQDALKSFLLILTALLIIIRKRKLENQ